MSAADQGSVTVTTVTRAFCCFARASPCSTALVAKAEPSVAIRICLYILCLLPGGLPVVGAEGTEGKFICGRSQCDRSKRNSRDRAGAGSHVLHYPRQDHHAASKLARARGRVRCA